jgi:hypothetical protein
MKKSEIYKRHHKVRRLPAEPLFSMFNGELNDAQMAAALRLKRSRIGYWRKYGIPFYQADEVACHIGVHPSYIWGKQWWQST